MKHIVLLSSAGTREQAEPAIGASYCRGEQALIRSAPSWTILRMNYYAEALADEARGSAAPGALTGFAENKVAFVGRDDVAAGTASSARTTVMPRRCICGTNCRCSRPARPRPD